MGWSLKEAFRRAGPEIGDRRCASVTSDSLALVGLGFYQTLWSGSWDNEHFDGSLCWVDRSRCEN